MPRAIISDCGLVVEILDRWLMGDVLPCHAAFTRFKCFALKVQLKLAMNFFIHSRISSLTLRKIAIRDS